MQCVMPKSKFPADDAHDSRAQFPWKPRPPEYHSYLLRLWRDQSPIGWRASLQSTRTSARHTFADLDSLLSFLLDETQATSD